MRGSKVNGRNYEQMLPNAFTVEKEEVAFKSMYVREHPHIYGCQTLVGGCHISEIFITFPDAPPSPVT